MSYRLSLLDKSPIAPGESPEQALARTAALAQVAEAHGYHRFWVAEHHGFAGLAGSAPEILAAFLLARTRTIRIGTGGVLLQHYSPFKVAESFGVLCSLAPGRVDLGIGKAPGGFPVATKALRAGRPPTDFADDLIRLNGLLESAGAADRLLDEAVSHPRPRLVPERFLLGASRESALLAARAGWGFVFAGQLNGDTAVLGDALGAYRDASGGRAPLLALTVLCAATGAEAQRQVANLTIVRVTLDTGQSVNLGTPEQAAEFARQAGAASFTVEERRPSVLAGAPEQVRTELARLSRQFGVEEFIVDTPVASERERFTSVQLLADATRSSIAAA